MKGFVDVLRVCGHIGHIHARSLTPYKRRKMEKSVCDECIGKPLTPRTDPPMTTRITYYQIVVSVMDIDNARAIQKAIITSAKLLPEQVKLVELEYNDGLVRTTPIFE